MTSSTLYLVTVCFFFFKQKTAYEMRISDWSSDVCSSDLTVRASSAIEGPFNGAAGPDGGEHNVLSLTELGEGVSRMTEGMQKEIGRASCRERVCQYVYI